MCSRQFEEGFVTNGYEGPIIPQAMKAAARLSARQGCGPDGGLR
jgi:hypothetical protein